MFCEDFSGFAYEILLVQRSMAFKPRGREREKRKREREKERRDLDLHQDANGLLVAAITLVVDLNKRTERGTALHLPQAPSLSHF
jgi:hypothetical protein